MVTPDDRPAADLLTSPGGDSPPILYCTWHPDREVLLRCARCGNPMCPDCSHYHPVGMRCKACMRELRSPVYKVGALEYARGFGVGFGLSFAMAFGFLLLGIWFLALLAATPAGVVVGDAVSWGAGRKRGRGLQRAAGAAVVLGTLALVALRIGALAVRVPVLSGMRGDLMGPILFAVIGAVAAYRRLR